MVVSLPDLPLSLLSLIANRVGRGVLFSASGGATRPAHECCAVCSRNLAVNHGCDPAGVAGLVLSEDRNNEAARAAAPSAVAAGEGAGGGGVGVGEVLDWCPWAYHPRELVALRSVCHRMREAVDSSDAMREGLVAVRLFRSADVVAPETCRLVRNEMIKKQSGGDGDEAQTLEPDEMDPLDELCGVQWLPRFYEQRRVLRRFLRVHGAGLRRLDLSFLPVQPILTPSMMLEIVECCPNVEELTIQFASSKWIQPLAQAEGSPPRIVLLPGLSGLKHLRRLDVTSSLDFTRQNPIIAARQPREVFLTEEFPRQLEELVCWGELGEELRFGALPPGELHLRRLFVTIAQHRNGWDDHSCYPDQAVSELVRSAPRLQVARLIGFEEKAGEIARALLAGRTNSLREVNFRRGVVSDEIASELRARCSGPRSELVLDSDADAEIDRGVWLAHRFAAWSNALQAHADVKSSGSIQMRAPVNDGEEVAQSKGDGVGKPPDLTFDFPRDLSPLIKAFFEQLATNRARLGWSLRSTNLEEKFDTQSRGGLVGLCAPMAGRNETEDWYNLPDNCDAYLLDSHVAEGNGYLVHMRDVGAYHVSWMTSSSTARLQEPLMKFDEYLLRGIECCFSWYWATSEENWWILARLRSSYPERLDRPTQV